MFYQRGLTSLFISACTIEFGNYLKDLRVSLGRSLADVESQSGISSITLRRIESGENMPRFDTLGYLSIAYKKDLLLELRDYCNSTSLFNYYIRLENLIISYDIELLLKLNSDFANFIKKSLKQNPLPLDTAIPNQFNLVLEGISQYYSYVPERSYETFLAAMKLTNPLFNDENFNRFRFSVFEMRILLLISLSLVYKQQIEKSNAHAPKNFAVCIFTIY